MKFELKIQSGNQAMVDDPAGELYRILHVVAEKVLSGHDGGWVKDINGNNVGRFDLSTGEESE